MPNASDFLIAANDEHGLNPPTAGKRTPIMPYLNRPLYENEFNAPTKYYFLTALVRLGYNVLDVKPEITDTTVSVRVARINRSRADVAVTFGYNAFGDGRTFNSGNGSQVYYSPANVFSGRSRALAAVVAQEISEIGVVGNRGVGSLYDIGVLQSVRCVSILPEPGYMTNFAEAKLMLDPDFQKAIAEKTAEGLSEYLGVPYTTTQPSLPTLRRGARSRAVLYLQYLLITYGYDVATADGIFGVNTQNAVIDFQSDNGLAADGIVGRNTWSALITPYTETPTLRRGSRGLYVRYAQQKLTTKLYPLGTPDGVFGSATEQAVREFQAENGLSVDGIIGRNTWARLKPIGGGRPLSQ